MLRVSPSQPKMIRPGTEASGNSDVTAAAVTKETPTSSVKKGTWYTSMTVMSMEKETNDIASIQKARVMRACLGVKSTSPSSAANAGPSAPSLPQDSNGIAPVVLP